MRLAIGQLLGNVAKGVSNFLLNPKIAKLSVQTQKARAEHPLAGLFVFCIGVVPLLNQSRIPTNRGNSTRKAAWRR